MFIFIHLIINALAIYMTAIVTPGVTVPDLFTALITALVMGLINTFIKPVLTLLTLPITILTLGLFSIILNTLLILLVSRIVPGFVVDGFISALIFGFIYSLINSILHKFSP